MPAEAALGVIIGVRVRELRERAGLSMRALAAAAGVSQPFLSQVEHGATSPSMITLYRLADALGTTPGDLLPVRERPVEVVRGSSADVVPVADRPDAARSRALLLAPDGLEVLEYTIEPGQFISEWFSSGGETAVYVIDGAIEVEVQGQGRWRLDGGDLIRHPSRIPHRWHAVAGVRAKVLLIGHPG